MTTTRRKQHQKQPVPRTDVAAQQDNSQRLKRIETRLCKLMAHLGLDSNGEAVKVQ